MRRHMTPAAVLSALMTFTAASQAAFVPWEPLTSDSWIVISPSNPKLTMHTANGGDYLVGFDQAASGNRARGLNALVFSYGGSTTGHLASLQTSGQFAVQNAGNARTFSDLLLVVAINAPALPQGFAMTLGPAGQTPYVLDPAADFGYYDHPAWATGRPSGYYSLTSPQGEPVAYAFASGMVSVFAAQGANLGPSGSVTFDYAFTGLPGRAVFSVYGLDAEVGWIYHTNRAVTDLNSPTSPLSTFEVTPEPSALALVACGAAFLARRRRR